MRDIRHLAGKASNLAKMLAYGRAFVTNFFIANDHKLKPHQVIPLPQAFANDIQWWLENISRWPRRRILFRDAFQFFVWGDACLRGYGFWLANSIPPSAAVAERAGIWANEDRPLPIAWKELKTILLALREFSHKFAHASVRIHTDSMVCAFILDAGRSKVPRLNNLVRSIATTCFEFDIELQVLWVPRGLNERADYLSKLFVLPWRLFLLTPSARRLIFKNI